MENQPSAAIVVNYRGLIRLLSLESREFVVWIEHCATAATDQPVPNPPLSVQWSLSAAHQQELFLRLWKFAQCNNPLVSFTIHHKPDEWFPLDNSLAAAYTPGEDWQESVKCEYNL